MKHAHRKDGAAMVRFEMELRRRMETGEGWTEFAASNYLTSLRMAQKDCLGASFETIAAYGANAAMMHYAPMKDTCAELEPRGFLLVDSGGQYRDGTTDITRTYALGPLTDEEREAYTLVLKCHIAAARAVFKAGSAGMHIDILARETLWRRGLDYRCGTGHGVGFVGVIHEGPQGLSAKNDTPFEPGMTVTDEPGIYEEGKLGVRIENELLCVPVCETEYGAFYGFEPFTYCPIDTRPLKLELMTREELEWLERLCPRAELHVLRVPAAMTDLMGSLALEDEPLRELYRTLRRGGGSSLVELARGCGLTVEQTLVGLTAFAQVRLVEFRLSPFTLRMLPPVKCAMADSSLIRYLRMRA